MDRLKLLSSQGLDQDAADAARLCLEGTVKLVWCMVRYPPENVIVARAAEAWHKSVQQVLLLRSSFMLSVFHHRVYFEDNAHETGNPTVDHFSDQLTQRRVRKVIFWQGVSTSDLDAFSELMRTKPDRLLESGGARYLLSKRGVDRVQVVENRYIPAGQQAQQVDGWEQKLTQSGLDSGEVIALLSGAGRMSRLLSDELLLLVEAMKDPQFLSQLLMKVAGDASPGGKPGAGELIRLGRRVQYLLAAHAGFDTSETPRVLSRAFRAMPGPVRLRLLAETYRQRRERASWIDDRLFDFTPEEYAQLIHHHLEKGGDLAQVASQMLLRPRMAESVAEAFRARLLTAPLARTDERESQDLAQALQGHLLRRRIEAPGEPRESFAWPTVDAAVIRPALEKQAAAFTHDVTEGYTYALLHLYRVSGEAPWSEALASRLAVIIEARLEVKQYPEVINLLQYLTQKHLAPEKLDRLHRLLGPALSRGGALLQAVVARLIQGDPAAANAMRVLLRACGPELWPAVFDLLLMAEQASPSVLFFELLAEHEGEIRPIASAMIHDDSPMKRVRAVELLAAMHSDELRAMGGEALRDRNRHVRLLSILAFAHGAEAKSIHALMEIARGARRASEAERCAAIHALGRIAHREAVPALGAILTRKGWYHPRAGWRLKAFAAAALRDIQTAEAFTTLRDALPHMQTTVADVVIAWIKRELAWLWSLAVAIGAAGVRLARAAWRAVLWVVVPIHRAGRWSMGALVRAGRGVVGLPRRLVAMLLGRGKPDTGGGTSQAHSAAADPDLDPASGASGDTR